MRNFFATLLLLFSITLVHAQGIVFHEVSLDEAMKMAKTDNKMVFVDCYTSWCVPCKQMVKNIFPLQECGDYMNDKFISIKKDMESEEGKVILNDYNVKVFPTYLIIKPSGELQYSFSGSMSLEEFIDKVESGIAQKKSSDELIAAYNSGNPSKEDLYNYLIFLHNRSDTRAMEPVLEEVKTKLTTADKCTEEYWEFMEVTTDLGFIANNYDAIKVGVSASTLEGSIPSIADSYIYNQIRYEARNLPYDNYAQMAANLKVVGLDNDAFLAYAKAADACCSGDYKQCMEMALDVMDQLDPSHQITTLRFVSFILPKEKNETTFAEVTKFIAEYKSHMGKYEEDMQSGFDNIVKMLNNYSDPNAQPLTSSH
ncbi:MAG: thioredoxin family protein [Rikenellaceae bacterium]